VEDVSDPSEELKKILEKNTSEPLLFLEQCRRIAIVMAGLQSGRAGELRHGYIREG